MALLEVKDLCLNYVMRTGAFWQRKKVLKVLDKVSFQLDAGETYALMGKSGCGKSSLARAILGLQAYESGSISLNERAQIVLQDPCESLNPRHQVKTILEEALIIQGLCRPSPQLIHKLLKDVNLASDPSFLSRYPHQLSGGERSRIVLARALSMAPKLLICDESLSMLDFYTQKQIMKLLQKLQEDYQISYLFISHDLNLVKQLTDKIYILDQGKISNYR